MTYKEAKCWSCDLDILVETHDFAPRNYCITCAYSKLALVSENQTAVYLEGGLLHRKMLGLS
jgi:Zn finger protein HypA/HybF involved in hydrogenase expression